MAGEVNIIAIMPQFSISGMVFMSKCRECITMKYISDDEYKKALSVFTEILNADVDVYDSEDIEAIKTFEDALDLCLDYERQCYGQKLNESLISAYMASKHKRATFPIKSIY